MKTIIYVRGTNATRQIKICEEYAAANNLDIIGAVNEESKLAVLVLGGNIDCVLVSDATRVTRKRKEYETTVHMLRGFGVKLVAAQGAAL